MIERFRVRDPELVRQLEAQRRGLELAEQLDGAAPILGFDPAMLVGAAAVALGMHEEGAVLLGRAAHRLVAQHLEEQPPPSGVRRR